VVEIEKAIKDLLPDIDDFYVQDTIHELVEYHKKFNEVEDTTWWLCLREDMRVKDWNNIRDQIRQDIIENDYKCYDYEDDKDKDDYTRGVLAAIHLIEHRVTLHL
jgi:hypothetical protein